jgi:hypothetical protein
MVSHRRSSANATSDAGCHLVRSDDTLAPVACILPANFSIGSAFPLDPFAAGNTRIPRLLVSPVLP